VRLSNFSITNFRSITKAYKVPVGDLTILIGPNNEGKSNILAALGQTLSLLSTGRLRRARRTYRVTPAHHRRRTSAGEQYDWQRDFPVQLRDTGKHASLFDVEFSLSDEEKEEFRDVAGCRLSTPLKLRVEIDESNQPKLKVRLQGKAQKSLNDNLERVLAFVQRRVRFQYVPAVRDEDVALEVVGNMLSSELAKLEERDDYQKALRKIGELQQPVLRRLEGELKTTIGQFVSEVGDVRLSTQDTLPDAVRRSCAVYMDDGVETELALKGDGIKSLTAIALMRRAAAPSLHQSHLVLAIEEPEAHLHPRAIRALLPILAEMAQSAQVMISTHSPLLVDALSVAHNVLVNDSKAVPAKSIEEVRTLLGVELQDNLQTAQLALLVEGTGDGKMLRTWLPALSVILADALRTGRLAVVPLRGASKLRVQASSLRVFACAIHAYLDNDEEAERAIVAAKEAGAVDDAEVQQCICGNMKESETEDLLNTSSYADALREGFGVTLAARFRSDKRKWSDRMRSLFEAQGKKWTRTVQTNVKSRVAEAAAAAGLDSLNIHKRSSVLSLKDALEARLSGRRAATR